MSIRKKMSAEELQVEYGKIMEGYKAPYTPFFTKKVVTTTRDRFVKFSLYNEQLRTVTSFETKAML